MYRPRKCGVGLLSDSFPKGFYKSTLFLLHRKIQHAMAPNSTSSGLQVVIQMNSSELEVKCAVHAQTWVNALQDVAKQLPF